MLPQGLAEVRPMNAKPSYVSVSTVARALDRSERTVRDWAERGRILARRPTPTSPWEILQTEIARIERGDPLPQTQAA